jgi:UDP-N-acetylmuramyl pentapeptide phosphotransferase/UDP-N-acetylglucosamine-1-phosphate transferase
MDWWWSALALALSVALAAALRDTLDVEPLLRMNFRGRIVPTGAGVAAVFAFVVVAAVVAVTDHPVSATTVATGVAVLGFGAVGFFDDAVGTHSARGLRGHLRAVARGQLTSGATKLVVGLALSALVSPAFAEPAGRRVLVTIVIAGAANVANLFDLAPARAAKVAAIAVVAIVIGFGSRHPLHGGPGWFFAAVLGVVPFELRERFMLGDAGANALGAVVGITAVRACGGHGNGLLVAAALVVLVNVAGELVSFSAVIERTPPLRVFDRLGRGR